MSGWLYRKSFAFAVATTVVVLAGSIATMAYPMLRADMHPRLEALKPPTPLQLAGRDVYQREGCVGCHTQTVRPLPSEVARYGDYSKAGEFYYEHPFLWGSKRTGPDLAREGGKRPDGWHRRHLENPQSFFARSNMPSYAWLAGRPLDPAEVTDHLNALALVHPELRTELAAVRVALAGKDEMDAVVAYLQTLGAAVPRQSPRAADLSIPNPVANDPAAIARGKQLFADNCAVCHGDEAGGQEGVAPSLVDDVFLGQRPDLPDAAYFAMISGGSDAKPIEGRKGQPDGGMAAFGSQLPQKDIWSIIAWIRAEKAHEAAEGAKAPAADHR